MIKITICIGSSCHLKGSRQVVEELKNIIAEKNLSDKIELSGTFCMGKCSEKGISVMVGNEYYSVSKEDVKDFFDKTVMPLVK